MNVYKFIRKLIYKSLIAMCYNVINGGKRMTIAEVSKKFDLTPDTLRYYEHIGLIPHVNRNKSGLRDYTEDDCRWVGFIKCMRNAVLPIEVLNEYVRKSRKCNHKAYHMIYLTANPGFCNKLKQSQNIS
jgi:DNA-binding transcriptional MerR regulator